VFGGCGSAVLAATFPQLGIGFSRAALAFRLTVLTAAYSIGTTQALGVHLMRNHESMGGCQPSGGAM
jgi:hypothetical protein